MSSSNIRAGLAAAEPLDDPGQTVTAPGTRRLLGALALDFTALYAAYGGVPGVLLADLVSRADPGGRSTAFGVIATVGAVSTLLANPIAGALSDRTRSRYGRRSPWMAGGALLGGLSLIALGTGLDLLWIGVVWALVQFTLGTLQAALTAVIPDRAPVERRGLFSSASGLASMGGATFGTALAAGFAHALGLGFAVFGLLVIAATAVFLLLDREESSLAAAVEPLRVGAFLRGFWISPRRHPDFAWAFLGRFLLMLGYFGVSSYQLYILEDYLGMSADRANHLVPLLSLTMLPALLVSAAVGGPLSDRIGRRKPIVVLATLGMGAALAIPLAVPSEGGMFAYSVLSGLSCGAYEVVDLALMTQVLPDTNGTAMGMGILNIAIAAPQALAPAMSAAAVAVFGGYRMLFAVAIILLVAGATSIMPIRTVR